MSILMRSCLCPTLLAIAALLFVLADGAAAGAADAIQVAPRTQDLLLYPCSQCHDQLATNPEVREVSAHLRPLEHGGGRIWCLDCHAAGQRDTLVAHGSEAYTFDQSSELCAVCHQGKYQDWRGGAHGKRVGNWQGERLLYGCVQCHDPHDPAIKPRAPSPPPSPRRGLKRPEPAEAGWQPSWQRADGDGQ